MDLDAALHLVEELTPSPAAAGVRGQAFSDDDVAVVPAMGLGSPRPSLAVGVTNVGGGDRYRIAVRVQDQAFESSSRLTAIVEAAYGEVDVEFIGTVRAQGLKDRTRPLHIGLSIAHVDVTAGTLGAFVERNGAKYVLSNNHVLANGNAGSNGDLVLQPGPADGGTAADRVAALAHFVPLDPTAANYVDCALGAIDVDTEIDLESPGYGTVRGVCPVEEAYEVQKLGRTTELTTGAVFTFNLNNLVVHYPGLGSVRFDRQIEIRGHQGRFSAGGDSGSLVVTDENVPRAVGLHFAGTDGTGAAGTSRSFSNPIDSVLDALSCELVT